MATKRKSAFSVYAEVKAAEEPQQQTHLESESKHTNGKSNNKKKNPNHNNQNNRVVPTQKEKNGKHSFEINLSKPLNGGVAKRKVEFVNKKEQNKYAKLPIETINESIKMFSNPKQANGNKLAKKNLAFIPKQQQQQPIVLSEKQFKKLVKQDTLLQQAKAVKKQKETKPVKILKEVEEDDNDLNEMIDEDMFDSRKEATKLFKHIINPVKNKEFFKVYWEKKPMLIKRGDTEYYKDWFSCKEFDSILRNHHLEFTTNIDVVTYINEVKQKHNPEGRAYAPLVWDFFQQGCSIRLLNPQTYSKNIWNYLSILQELFGTCVGANTYLTPAGTQGFAPHYDDIEAFVLQLEGKKRWRVYNPINKQETLPRFSSPNFKESDIGAPIIDVILEPGDLLYFPRGFIHQAIACDDTHSLHITVSCYQKNSWGDFLMKLLPGAIEIAMEESVEFRRGLPINYLVNNGVAFDNEELKKTFVEKTASLMSKLIKYAPIDSAVDQMGKQFLNDSLPPCFTESEKARSIHGNGERWNEKKNRVDNVTEMEPDTAIKLIRKNCLRLVVEQDSCLIYHNLDNTRIYQEKESQYLEVEADVAPAVEFLIKSYPNYVTVEELPIGKSLEEKLVLASCLYDKGLIITGEPLQSQSDDESDECDTDEDDDDDVDDIDQSNGNSDEISSDDDQDIEEDEDDDEDVNEEDFNSEDYDKNADEDDENIQTESNDDQNDDEEDDADDDDDENEDDNDDSNDDEENNDSEDNGYGELESGVGPHKNGN